jgi:hypothetical protein
MSTRRAYGQAPRMPDALPDTRPIAPMPKRVELPQEGSGPDAWWHRIITVWRGPKGKHLLPCQIEYARQAWVNAGRPAQWAPPIQTSEDKEAARELAEERAAMQAGA